MNETFTLYKLMILYLLKKVKFPLATTQISDFMLGMEYSSSVDSLEKGFHYLELSWNLIL